MLSHHLLMFKTLTQNEQMFSWIVFHSFYHDTPLNFMIESKIKWRVYWRNFYLTRGMVFILRQSILRRLQMIQIWIIKSKFPEIDPGVFYVKRVNDLNLKSHLVTNLYNDNFVSVSGIVTNNYFCVMSSLIKS